MKNILKMREFILEKLDSKKMIDIVGKLFNDYKFHVYRVDTTNRQKTIENVIDVYKKGFGILPNNLQGVALVTLVKEDQYWIEILSNNKAIVKQMMDKINQNWSNFSDTENKKLGHDQNNNTYQPKPNVMNANLDKNQTNIGSKGTYNVNKSAISQPNWTRYEDKDKKPQFLNYVTIWLR